MDTNPAHLRLVRTGLQDTDERSDDELMALAAAGQESAFVALVRRHEQSVRRFCEVILGNKAQAEDAAQECFLLLWNSKDRFRPKGRFKELLFTIARNHCRSLHRRRWFQTARQADESTEEALAEVADPQIPDMPLLQHEQEALVGAALHKLPEKFRLPLLLRFVENMPYDEIAEVIGRTPSAARSRIHYGLKELAKFLPDEVCP